MTAYALEKPNRVHLRFEGDAPTAEMARAMTSISKKVRDETGCGMTTMGTAHSFNMKSAPDEVLKILKDNGFTTESLPVTKCPINGAQIAAAYICRPAS